MKYRPKRLRRLDRVGLNNGQPTYFITICTENRRPLLANDAVHQRLREFLTATPSHHDWWPSRYLLMPDHLHLFATPGLSAVTLGAWIKALKAMVGNREFKWQIGFFDHVLRSSESKSQKWEYIRENPVRAGLAANADAWPFGGDVVWDDVPAREHVTRPPRQETRPTSATHDLRDADATDVGPISRSAEGRIRPTGEPGGGVTWPGDNASSPPLLLAAKQITLTRRSAAAPPEMRSDYVAAEEPLEIRVENHSIAVVMRTPGHDRELAAGFLLTENIIRSAADIFDITQCGTSPDENIVIVTLRNPAAFDATKLTRNVFSSSSCGICSKATIEAVRQQFRPVQSDCRVSPETILRLPALLRQHQQTFEQTGGLHACALFDPDGTLLALREDVGRHNALDKLIGHALLQDQLPLHNQLLLLSGRVSFEMVQKALAAGIPIIAAISAPTSLAVEFARENNQTLIGFLRGETMNIYSAPERVQ